MISENYLRLFYLSLMYFREKHYGIISHKRAFQRFAFDKLESINIESFDRLRKMIHHAYHTSPYYLELWKKIGFKPELFRAPEDIKELPFLTKDIIEKEKNRMISERFVNDNLELSYTGGSSGTPTSFYRNREATAQRIGRQLGILELCGYSVGDRCGLIWGAHQDIGDTHSALTLKGRLKKFLNAKEVLNCSVMNSESMRDYHEKLKRFKPRILYGYPNAMSQFANFIEENNLEKIKVNTIISTAERLSEDQRKLFQDVFEGEVYNLYCTREHGCIGFECRDHNGFHIDTGSVYLEIVTNGRVVNDGETGDIVVTDLLNYGMPFIRYEIGDRGSISPEPCSCGCKLPLLSRLDGRISDMLYRPDGSLVAGIMLIDLFLNEPAIRNIQIVQDSLHEVDLFVVVADKFIEEHKAKAVKRMGEYLGEGVKVNVRVVSEIPRNPISGKFQEVISKVKPPLTRLNRVEDSSLPTGRQRSE